MSSAVCKGCGRITNSTTSNMWFTKDRIPTECYVAWVDNKPVKGCGYDKLDKNEKYSPLHFANHILNSEIDWGKNVKKD